MTEKFRQQPIFRTVMLFVCLFCVAALLIMLGRRNDAMTQAYYSQAGVVMADEVAVSARHVSGTLISRPVIQSQEVTKGEVLMVLDDSDYKIALAELMAQKDQYEADIRAYENSIAIAYDNYQTTRLSTRHSLESTLAKVKSAEATLVTATSDHSRYQRLLKDKAVSQSDYDRIHSEYISAQASLTQAQNDLDTLLIGASDEDRERFLRTEDASDVETTALRTQKATVDNMTNTLNSMKAQLANLRLRINQAELDLSRTIVTAPCDGKILEFNFEEGELVGANAPAVILEKRERYVDLYLPEGYATAYKASDKVTLFAPVLGKEYQGTVRFVNPAPSYASLRMTREQGQADLTSYEMRVYIDDPSLLPGITLELTHD